MAEPLKNLFNATVIQKMAENLTRVSDQFDEKAFLRVSLDELDRLELMERSVQIGEGLDAGFSGTFEQSANAMLRALHPAKDLTISDLAMDDTGIADWAVMPLAAFIARHGLHDPVFSLNVLREMTMRSSSEFAVRPFFRDHPQLTVETAMAWARDSNVHVRRLASEGSRPRLPWGIRLQNFVEDPAPVLPILEALRDDPEEYVRRSVANHLNDIAKDHPDVTISIAAKWIKQATADRKRLVKHACRTLIKGGHADALKIFGIEPPDLAEVKVSLSAEKIKVGDDFHIDLQVTAGLAGQKLLIDYIIHFLRANGKHSPKVFKWSTLDLKPGETRDLRKTHAYRKVTTRKDYAGTHRVTVQINGQDFGGQDFALSL